MPEGRFMTETRRRLLDELRRRRVREAAHELTPAERLAQADDLRAFALQACPDPTGGRTDEPPELWLRLLARRRELDRRRAGTG